MPSAIINTGGGGYGENRRFDKFTNIRYGKPRPELPVENSVHVKRKEEKKKNTHTHHGKTNIAFLAAYRIQNYFIIATAFVRTLFCRNPRDIS